MAGHIFPLLLDKLRDISVFVCEQDPNDSVDGPGLNAAQGSLCLRVDTPTLFVKSGPQAAPGAAITDWVALGGVPSTLAATTTVGTGGIVLDDQGANAGIDVGDSTRAACTPFADFHFGKSAAQDYNVRLINDADGRMHVLFAGGASTLQVDGVISATGEIQSTSDRRAKIRVRRLTGALELVKRLRGVRFAWRQSGDESVGLIAQEVERVLPELVDRPPGRRMLRTVAYGNLTAVLIEALKELATRVERLERERQR